MRNQGYTDERGAQIVVALLKAHGIRFIVASPGSTNICVVRAFQKDSFFTVYSSVDERSAAYIACGVAAESREPVVICCTGATASRNYYPGLTEAYYRRLPVLALTCSQPSGRVGHLVPQVTCRNEAPSDVVKCSIEVPLISSGEAEWTANVDVNRALLALRTDGGGPAHINLVSEYATSGFEVEEIPPVRSIERYGLYDEWPDVPSGLVAIMVGSHEPFTPELEAAIDGFCGRFDAVVYCDHTSNYQGAFRLLGSPLLVQDQYESAFRRPDLLLHIGSISGAYFNIAPKEVWRIDIEGAVVDTYRCLSKVFAVDETAFFQRYGGTARNRKANRHAEAVRLNRDLMSRLGELPFSNLWIASKGVGLIPQGSRLHLGILNTLRAWNFFEVPSGVPCYSNVGGFGIDGCISSAFGAALANPNALHFVVLGDLAFFYDMNVLGNRHFPSNIRILLVNNGEGTEFRNYSHTGSKFGDSTGDYISAKGHFLGASNEVARAWCEGLGLAYLSASSKEEFLDAAEIFFASSVLSSAIVLEVFTEPRDESEALFAARHLRTHTKKRLVAAMRKMLGPTRTASLRRIVGRR